MGVAVAILVGFPIGGYLADLVVDGVDSVGTALVGGLITGVVIGAAEWFALRRWVSWLWIAATTVGMAAGLTAGAALVDYGISRGDLVLMGAVTGVGVGGLQALVLARHRVPGAFWWAVANPPAWGAWLAGDLVLTLAEWVEEYLGAHQGERVTIAKLRWLLGKATVALGEVRLAELSPDQVSGWRLTVPEGHRFEGERPKVCVCG